MIEGIICQCKNSLNPHILLSIWADAEAFDFGASDLLSAFDHLVEGCGEFAERAAMGDIFAEAVEVFVDWFDAGVSRGGAGDIIDSLAVEFVGDDEREFAGGGAGEFAEKVAFGDD